MVKNVENIVGQALALSPEDRLSIISRLIRSVEDDCCPTEAEVEAAWAVEIAKRVDEIDRGEVDMIPWETVREQMKAIVDRARG